MLRPMQNSPSAAYARAHYAARKVIRAVCEQCGATGKVEAALRPATPAARLLLDPNINCLYSLDPADYFALCVPCHRKLDHVELRAKCSRGHDYTPDNTSVKTDGSRRCLTCHRENEARRLEDPDARAAKVERARYYRQRTPMTAEQKARKVALQRLRRLRDR